MTTGFRWLVALAIFMSTGGCGNDPDLLPPGPDGARPGSGGTDDPTVIRPPWDGGLKLLPNKPPLRGDVTVPRPPCLPADDSCRKVVIDENGVCGYESLADGTACQAPLSCIRHGEGSCQAGRCVAPSVCEDGDPCTAGTCNGRGSCVQEPRNHCPEPDNPCFTAVCDSETGCGIAPMADGSACGDGDCTTEFVCIAGACVTRPAGEGSPCVGICGNGTCRGGVCESTTGTAKLLWSYEMPPWLDATWDIDGTDWPVIDDDGNYLLAQNDCRDSWTTELVKVSTDGQVLAQEKVDSHIYQIRVAEDRIIGYSGQNAKPTWIEGYSSDDLQLLWRRDYPGELGLRNESTTAVPFLGPLSRSENTLFVRIRMRHHDLAGATSQKEFQVLGVDASTGDIRWTTGVQQGEMASDSVLSDDDSVVVSVQNEESFRLHAISQSGGITDIGVDLGDSHSVLAFRTVGMLGPTFGVVYRFHDIKTGATLDLNGIGGSWDPSHLIADDIIVIQWVRNFVVWDRRTESIRLVRTLPEYDGLSPVLFTNRGTLLFAEKAFTSEDFALVARGYNELVEIDLDGRELNRCLIPMPDDRTFARRLVLSDGKLVVLASKFLQEHERLRGCHQCGPHDRCVFNQVSMRAFDARGLSLADRAWYEPWGDFQGTRKARDVTRGGPGVP